MAAVEWSQEGPVVVLTLNNPPLNVLNLKMFAELGAHVERANGIHDVRTVVIRGAGQDHFTAGGDIKEMFSKFVAKVATEARTTESRKWLEEVHSTMNRIHASPKIFICALKGISFGGGIELAAACDIRVASKDAQFSMPEVKIGLIPGYGGTQRLSRLLGSGRALALILSGQTIAAQEAYNSGLIDFLVPEGQSDTQAMRLAQAMADNSPAAMTAAKRVVHEGAEMDLALGLELEIRNFSELSAGPDLAEGIRAFSEKRPPKFGYKNRLSQ